MPTIQLETIIPTAAPSVVDNVLVGSQWLYLPYDARVEFGLVASATGILCDVYSGQDLLAEGFRPSLLNRFPVYPDDFTLEDVAAAGEALKVRARNITGGDLTLRTSVKLTPLM
jgi:hypothetical protein